MTFEGMSKVSNTFLGATCFSTDAILFLAGLFGAVIRIFVRPDNNKSFWVDQDFPSHGEAQAAVAKIAVQEGVIEAIQRECPAFNNPPAQQYPPQYQQPQQSQPQAYPQNSYQQPPRPGYGGSQPQGNQGHQGNRNYRDPKLNQSQQQQQAPPLNPQYQNQKQHLQHQRPTPAQKASQQSPAPAQQQRVTPTKAPQVQKQPDKAVAKAPSLAIGTQVKAEGVIPEPKTRLENGKNEADEKSMRSAAILNSAFTVLLNGDQKANYDVFEDKSCTYNFFSCKLVQTLTHFSNFISFKIWSNFSRTCRIESNEFHYSSNS